MNHGLGFLKNLHDISGFEQEDQRRIIRLLLTHRITHKQKQK